MRYASAMPSFFSRLTGGSPQEVSLTISARTFFKIVLLVIATMLLLTLLRSSVYAVTLILVAFFLALALTAPVGWLSAHLPGKLRDRRPVATALTFLAFILVLATFLLNVVPPILHETQQFIAHAPQTVDNLRSQYHAVNEFIVRYH